MRTSKTNLLAKKNKNIYYASFYYILVFFLDFLEIFKIGKFHNFVNVILELQKNLQLVLIKCYFFPHLKNITRISTEPDFFCGERPALKRRFTTIFQSPFLLTCIPLLSVKILTENCE